MTTACFVCSEPHWHHKQLTEPAIDPMAPCIHRERELVEWELNRQLAQIGKLTEMPEQTRNLATPIDSGSQRAELPVFQLDLRDGMPERIPPASAIQPAEKVSGLRGW